MTTTSLTLRRIRGTTFREVIHKIAERIQEKRFGIKTAGYMSEEALGFSSGDGRHHYTPLPYAAIERFFASVAPNPEKDVFVDWGAGMGRVLVLASARPYRKVVGVEHSPILCAAAERNLKTARLKQRCGSIEVINADARDFPIPEDSSVMFFYNPFRGEVLQNVVRRIRASWETHRRPITFLVSNHAEFIADTGSEDWLKSVSKWTAYPSISCCVIRSADS